MPIKVSNFRSMCVCACWEVRLLDHQVLSTVDVIYSTEIMISLKRNDDTSEFLFPIPSKIQSSPANEAWSYVLVWQSHIKFHYGDISQSSNMHSTLKMDETVTQTHAHKYALVHQEIPPKKLWWENENENVKSMTEFSLTNLVNVI